MKILEQNSTYLGAFHNINITKDVIKEVYKLAKDKIKDIKFPQKGLNLLDQACSRALIRKSRVPNVYKNLVDRTYLLAQGLDKSLEKRDYEAASKKQGKALETRTRYVFDGKRHFHKRPPKTICH
jgi:ATP-dependent Clp protease ATP-binding subunit ClpC